MTLPPFVTVSVDPGFKPSATERAWIEMSKADALAKLAALPEGGPTQAEQDLQMRMAGL